MRFHCEVIVELKDGLLDPQGKAIEEAVPTMGFAGVSNFRVGKVIEFDIDAASVEKAAAQVDVMGDRLLSNPVIETYRYTLRGEDDEGVSTAMGVGSKVEMELS